ncbi:pentatricopeptide repeat-containing protein At4g02750-like [Selaginella moellendorffii]|uniref:pentatricopeptide repeat-containing protein At4g02750-like n=1 Tax=Selaginella moellendorffii TaxID=88036 RepID=UPI000D1D03E4|nr:pentatricopeptide repeat-containing protein At4g02750-like [Selaginella moellendorffii]|eukprot:XP_024530731.1 pentatricopeptide repeat-containing protein At4g02750-like [Selaginella moellendorffii]
MERTYLGDRQQLELRSYLRLVKSCKDLVQAHHIHAQIVLTAHSHDRLLLNSLIEMYGKCGDVATARRIFDAIPSRNVYSWNILLAAYSQNGHLEEAMELFQSMKEKDCTSWNSMLTAFARAGNLESARSLFDQIPRRDVVSWNAMIATFAKNGDNIQALRLFRLMCLDGCKTSEITFVNALDACGNAEDLEEGRRLDRIITENRLDCGVELGTSLVDMYHRCHSPDDAKIAFQRMPFKDPIAWTAMIQVHSQCGELDQAREIFDMRLRQPRPVASWNAMIAAYSQKARITDAKNLFDAMPDADRDVVTWTTMIWAYGEAKNADAAQNLFDRSPHRNSITWNAMAAAHSQCCQSRPAFALLQRMDLDGVEPNAVTVISVLDACAGATDLATGKNVDAITAHEPFHRDVVVSTATIHMYGRCGSLAMARAVLAATPRENLVTWTAMVSAYAHNGHSGQARETFQTMTCEGFPANSVAFVSILNGCSHGGLLDDGVHYFVTMVAEYGVSSKLDHFVCLVDLLGRAGKLEAAEELVNSMPYCPDFVSWMTLLAACKTHKDVRRAEAVARNVVAVDPKDSAAYALLSAV